MKTSRLCFYLRMGAGRGGLRFTLFKNLGYSAASRGLKKIGRFLRRGAGGVRVRVGGLCEATFALHIIKNPTRVCSREPLLADPVVRAKRLNIVFFCDFQLLFL